MGLLNAVYSLVEGTAYRDVPGEDRPLLRHLDRLYAAQGSYGDRGRFLTLDPTDELSPQAAPAPAPWATLFCHHNFGRPGAPFTGERTAEDLRGWLDERLPRYVPVLLLGCNAGRPWPDRPPSAAGLGRLVLAATSRVSIAQDFMTLADGGEWRLFIPGGRTRTLWTASECHRRFGRMSLGPLRFLATRRPPLAVIEASRELPPSSHPPRG